MDHRELLEKLNEDNYKNMGKLLLQLESISKIRRYGPDTYFKRLETSINGYFTDFMPMFLYLSRMETLLTHIDEDDTHVK